MSGKILVAGAGHGGLCAAIHLAKSGFDVTVFEKNGRKEMGYDWSDFVDVGTFSCVGLDDPPCERELFYATAFFGPGKDVKLVKNHSKDRPCVAMERKEILCHLLDEAEKSGAKLIFNAQVKNALTNGDRVVGIEVAQNGNEEKFYGDLVIDAAGVYSPVRRSLPEKFGIQRDFEDFEIYTGYRALFQRKSNYSTSPKYSIYFYHCNRKGMDWVITDNDYVDVLVGNFGELSQKDIDEAIDDFRKDYDCLSDKIVRGGTICKIPVRKALDKFVCGGYAAVGDSAAMTEPLCGSGMTISMRAGKMLADALMETNDASAFDKALEKYEKEYFAQIGKSRLFDDASKNFLLSVGAEKFDKMIKRNILTEKDFGGGKYTFKETLRRVWGFVRTPSILPDAIRFLSEVKKTK